MATNLRPKKTFLAKSVQPQIATNYVSFAATTTVSKVARENPNRKELIVTNTSTAPLYLAFSNLPTATDYAVAVPPGGAFFTESTDAVNGVWASAGGGQANVTERT